MKSIASVAAILLAAPAFAADFQPPLGCQTYLTAQNRGCEVTNYYRCEADPDGYQWSADFGINGKTYVAQIDGEGQWIASFSYGSGLAKELDAAPADPASLSTLFSEGYDAMVFSQTARSGERFQYEGFDRLTGETVMIDGVPLKRTEFEFTEYDAAGNLIRKVTGNEFVSEEFNRFFGGRVQVRDADGTSFPYDGSPVEFIFPGEPGFGATVPKYECNDMLSSLITAPEEYAHDQI